MAIVKANYTRKGGIAKASVRYIENRPGRDGTKIVRTLFNADGKLERGDAYAMIDQAATGSYFFRLVISPDPQREDRDKNAVAAKEPVSPVIPQGAAGRPIGEHRDRDQSHNAQGSSAPRHQQ